MMDEEEMLRGAESDAGATLYMDEPLMYTVIEAGTSRGKLILMDSMGHQYTRKVDKRRPGITWRCCKRSKPVNCKATVIERGGYYVRGTQQHVCQSQLGRQMKKRRKKSLSQKHHLDSALEIEVEEEIADFNPAAAMFQDIVKPLGDASNADNSINVKKRRLANSPRPSGAADYKQHEENKCYILEAPPVQTAQRHCPRNFLKIACNECTYHTEDWKNKQTTIYTPLCDDIMVNTHNVEQISFSVGLFHVGNEESVYTGSAQGHVLHLWKYDAEQKRIYVYRSFLFTDPQVYSAIHQQLEDM